MGGQVEMGREGMGREVGIRREGKLGWEGKLIEIV